MSSGVIDRLIRLSARHARRVLAGAVAVFAVAAAFGLPVTETLTSSPSDFQRTGSQHERTDAAIERATGQSPAYGVVALLQHRDNARRDQRLEHAARRVALLLSHQPGFQRERHFAGARSRDLVSRDGRQALVVAAFATPKASVAAAASVRSSLARARAHGRLAGIAVRFGGQDLLQEELSSGTASDLRHIEAIVLPIVLLLSFWFFRGLVAAFLPLLVGGFAIVLTFLLLRLIDQLTGVSVFALNLVTGMGLGLGIDYSLFVLSRYREELARGLETRAAVARTLQTAGRTVLYSSVTVAAALVALLVFPLRFLYSMGIGGALVALSAGAVSLIVLPALLIALGSRINALAPRWLQRSAERSTQVNERGAWSRLARGVMRRPGVVGLVTASALLAAAVPAVRLHIVPPGANLLPPTAESRIVEHEVERHFPANPAQAIQIVVHASGHAATPGAAALPPRSVRRFAARAARTAGRQATPSPPLRLGRGTWLIALVPHGSPYSDVNQALVRRVRTQLNPAGALVGGATAYVIDQRRDIAARIPLALATLFVLSAAFLFLMTGSVILAVKSFVMNFLTTGAAVGLLVLIFQDGRLDGLLGLAPSGGLEEANLIVLLVITFALATDYQVFLLGRILEARAGGLGDRQAVATGLERTGRLITAAALIFCVSVGGFVASQVVFVKQFGLGAALGVAIDASIVRALLVPALMALLGSWNWWAPRPLRALHARIGLSETGA